MTETPRLRFEPQPFDAYAPPEIARRIEEVGVAKAALPFLPLFALALLAGAFIALGAMFQTLVVTGSGLGFGPNRLLGGIAFSLGLVLVLVGGAELFTGNALIVMGWAGRRIATGALLRNWAIAYVGNLAGALGMVGLAAFAGLYGMGEGGVGATAVAIASAKAALPFDQAFFSGILGNVLVCLAVWLCFAAHDVASRILAIVFPISAFVALGFEHSIANMYLIPAGIAAAADPAVVKALVANPPPAPGLSGFVSNLVPVTLGNLVGGGVFVALTYWVIYLRAPNGDHAA